MLAWATMKQDHRVGRVSVGATDGQDRTKGLGVLCVRESGWAGA